LGYGKHYSYSAGDKKLDIFNIGPEGTVHIFGIKLVGVNAENAGKFAMTNLFIGCALGVGIVLRGIARRYYRNHRAVRVEFWTRQAINLGVAVFLILGILSIWFDDPSRLSTGLGLVTAGLAFALQKVVTSIAGYFVILRGKTFNVGDRIVMGGVRGDVIELGFTQTTILEMGQPPSVDQDDPAMWVKSRQYTGRIVIVPNAKIFDEPVYNYTRDFAYIWEEIRLPIAYTADRKRAEAILLEAVSHHHIAVDTLNESDRHELDRRFYAIKLDDFSPKVYWRLTDNWLEMSARFLTHAHGVRDVKDRISREVLPALEASGIGLASTTFEIVGLPPIKLKRIR
jgi:small-conductance mechanosensitive channel